jgi:hypothetical protein
MFGNAAKDGVYTTHPASKDIGVYCDMTNGAWTYEDFGFGQFNVSYAGYALVGAPDFKNSTQFDAAFAYLYDRQSGLTNLSPGWSSSNCCITNTTKTDFYALAASTGAIYMYPANSSDGQVNCNGVYSDAIMRLSLYVTWPPVVRTSFTSSEAGDTKVDSFCSINNNPGIFVKRYQ